MNLKSKTIHCLGLISLALLGSEVSADGNDTQLELDEVKIQLISKGSIAGKKIRGPDKQLLKMKIANELNAIKSTPESINAENLDLLDLGSEAVDDATATKPIEF
jgi:hypothetical protein